MRRHALALAAVAALFTGTSASGQGTPENAKALDAYLEAWDAAYNAHDASTLSNLYAEDADQVLEKGERFKGRAAIEKASADMFSKNPNIRVRTVADSRRFLGPDLVIEDGRWEISGHTDKDLAPKGLYTVVLVKRGGKWLTLCERVSVPVSEPGASGSPETK